MSKLYKNIINEFKNIANFGPKPPKRYNLHKMVPSPMSPKTLGEIDPFMKPLQLKSELYDKTKSSGIPLPRNIQRHCLSPIASLENESSMGKIVGFRIEVKGRVGSRSMRRAVNYGSLDVGKIGPMTGTYVDFGRSNYVTKRGVTGVKVWIAYGNK
jgi:hypothetical protein